MLSPSEAEELARKLGEPIGHITVSETALVGSEEHNIMVDIPYENYVKSPIRVGELIGILTLTGNIVLGRVIEVRRSHVAGISGRVPIFTTPTDTTGLETPAQVTIEPITECPANNLENCDPTPVYTPIDPLSIALKPNKEVITKLLALPNNGILLGHLYVGGRTREDVEVRVPEYVLYEHMLLVGTTGSGKTTLLKNLALAIMRQVSNATVVALDLQGDYLHVTLPPDRELTPKALEPLDEITIIEPITRKYLEQNKDKLEYYADEYVTKEAGEEATIADIEDLNLFGKALAYVILRDTLERSYGKTEITNFNANIEEAEQGIIRIREIEAQVKAEGREFRLRLIPYSLNFNEVFRELPRLFPIFSYRVSLVFDRVIATAMDYMNRRDINCSERLSERGAERCPRQTRTNRQQATTETGMGRTVDFDAIMMHLDCVELAAACMRLAPNQRESIIRGLNMIESIGIMDVKWRPTGSNLTATFTEPNPRRLSGFVDVDLRLFREDPRAASIIVYRTLDQIFKARDEELRKGLEPKPTFILIDEAHNYFPQSNTQDVDKEAVEEMINRLTRLGRVRKIGVIFATHTPNDLNELVLQLTNTKIALRSEEAVLEKVGLKDYAHELTYAQDGVAVIRSYALRTHTLTMKALPPQVKHRSHK